MLRHLAAATALAAMFSYAALTTEDPVESAVFTAQDTMPEETHGRALFLHHALHAMANVTQSKTEDEKLRLARSVWHQLSTDSHTFWTHRASTARLARDRLDFLLTNRSTRLSRHHQSLASQDLMNHARLQLRNIPAGDPRASIAAPQPMAMAMDSEPASGASLNEDGREYMRPAATQAGAGSTGDQPVPDRNIKVESEDQSTQANALGITIQPENESNIKLEEGSQSPQLHALDTAELITCDRNIKAEDGEQSTQADALNTAEQSARTNNIQVGRGSRALSILSSRNGDHVEEPASSSLGSRKRKLRHDKDSDDEQKPPRHGLDPNARTDTDDDDGPAPALELPEPLVIPRGTSFAEIERVHAKLHRRNPKWAAVFAAMFKEPVAEAGRTLFKCHLAHLLANEAQVTISVDELWAAQNETSRKWWADHTTKAMTGNGGNRYIGFVSPTYHKKITQQLQDRAQAVLNQELRLRDQWQSAFVLRALTGVQSVNAALKLTPEQIASCIQHRLKKYPKIFLRGRGFGQIRIDYHPKGSGPNSILTLWAHSQTAEGSIASLEALLQPLAIWNKDAFPELGEEFQPNVGGVNDSCHKGRDPFESKWKEYGRARDLLLSPIGYDRDEVIEALVLDMRRKCQMRDSKSTLLLDPKQVVGSQEWTSNKSGFLKKRLQDWSLFDVDHGFGAQIKLVFEEAGLSAEQYAERIERRISAFADANPTAVRDYS